MEVGFRSGVSEADFVKVGAGADQLGMRCFLSNGRSEIQSNVCDDLGKGLLDQRVGMSVQTSGEFSHEICVSAVT